MRIKGDDERGRRMVFEEYLVKRNAMPSLDSKIAALAHSVCRELYRSGFRRHDVIMFAKEVLQLVSAERGEVSGRPPSGGSTHGEGL